MFGAVPVTAPAAVADDAPNGYPYCVSGSSITPARSAGLGFRVDIRLI